jgi:hypothetical protein
MLQALPREEGQKIIAHEGVPYVWSREQKTYIAIFENNSYRIEPDSVLVVGSGMAPSVLSQFEFDTNYRITGMDAYERDSDGSMVWAYSYADVMKQGQHQGNLVEFRGISFDYYPPDGCYEFQYTPSKEKHYTFKFGEKDMLVLMKNGDRFTLRRHVFDMIYKSAK